MLFKVGVSYYPDYLSETGNPLSVSGNKLALGNWKKKLKADFARMKKDGINIVRMGEFSWSHVEPSRGQLQTERFKAALDQASANDIQVIFCTPTATPPKWLIDESPDILPVTRAGDTIPFGTRRHYDPSNQTYRKEAERIVKIYAEQFGKHKAIIGWQLDNEFGCHDSMFSFTKAALKRFRQWLRQKYKTIDKLNEEWFTSFWSQNYSNFEQIELPFQSWCDQNPQLELDFRRFANDMYVEFAQLQANIIREICPDKFITHNLMSKFSDLSPWRLATVFDIAGFDHYQVDSDPEPTDSHWQFSLMYSLKNEARFLVLEQQPLQVNWQKTNKRFAYDWLYLWGAQSAFLGAEALLYFSWQRFYGGPEQYHDGIVPHDVRVERSWQERIINSQIDLFKEIGRLFQLSELPKPVAKVICIHNYESLWTHEITSQSVEYSTFKQLSFVTEFCQQHGLGLGFAESIEAAAERGQLAQAECLFLPGYAFELTDKERTELRKFVERGGSVVSLPRSFMKKKNNQMSPLPLSIFSSNELLLEDFGAVSSEEVEILRAVSGDERFEFSCGMWAEKIKIKSDWEVVATYRDGLYAGDPGVIRRTFSNGGTYIHFASCPHSTSPIRSWLMQLLPLKPDVVSDQAAHFYPLKLGDREFCAGLNFTRNAEAVQFSRPVKRLFMATIGQDQELLCKTWLDCGKELQVLSRCVLLAEF